MRTNSERGQRQAHIDEQRLIRLVALESCTDAIGDDPLLSRYHAGDQTAFATLYGRHARDAHRFAGSLLRQGPDSADARDAVAEAVRKVLSAMDNGAGPCTGFRPYLFTAIRSAVVVPVARRHPATVSIDSLRADLTPMSPGADHLASDHQTDDKAALTAWATLQPRWRHVLWETEVNGLRPCEAAAVFGLEPNSFAVLAGRARTGLRAAYDSQNEASDR